MPASPPGTSVERATTTPTDDGRRTDTRQRLVDSAIALFRARGVSGTGVDQLCREAGVTKGVFAHHFPGGKHELIAAAIERNAAEVRALLTRIREREGHSAPAMIRGFFSTYARLYRKHGPAFGCPVAAVAIESGAEPADAELAGAAFASWRTGLRELYEELDTATATLVIAAFEGAILLARSERDSSIFDQVGEALAALVESSTRTKGASL